MATILLVLLGVVVVSTLAFLALMFRLSLDDKDFWLKAMSGTLLTITFFVSVWALRTGHLVGQEQSARTADAQLEAGKANKAAGEANERAGLANREAARIEAESNEKIAGLTTEAEALKAEAEKAKAERAEADKQIAIAKANAAQANEGAVKATAEVARLQIVVANAEAKRAAAERELLELRERIQHRHLTPEQRARLIEVLNAGQKGEVLVESLLGDGEAFEFASELEKVLKEAGWTVSSESGQAVFVGAKPVGLQIGVNSLKNVPLLAAVLQHALTSVGLSAPGFELNSVSPGAVHLVVGAKY